jgi:hypothetical protein
MDTWRLTRPVGVPFTLIHIILGAIGLGIAAAATALVGGGFELAGFGSEDNPSPVLDLAVSTTDTVFSLLYLLLATTLFGFMYRRLAPPDA